MDTEQRDLLHLLLAYLTPILLAVTVLALVALAAWIRRKRRADDVVYSPRNGRP